MRALIFIISLIFGLSLEVSAQELKTNVYVGTVTEEGDTLAHVELNPVIVRPQRFLQTHHDVRKFWRLARKVKKVYPYAKKAAELLHEYDAKYVATNDPKLRRQYVRQAEKKLFDEYGPQLKKLSISEGRILIKLIDRETKHTSYELIRDLKGGLSAFLWQGVARLFGNDLKQEYDPVVEDRMIERIIYFIDTGVI